jgi:hypothetical protein
MANTGGTIAPAPPAVKQIKNPGAVKVPKGPSVAAQMVKNSRANQRQQHASRARAPKPPTPYNALNSQYGSQKSFEKGVEQNAKSQYQPELNQLNAEQGGEQGLHAQRESDNVNIYKQYSEQAQQAFNQAKSTMAEIAARQNSSTAAGQQALQAALSNTGVSGLSSVGNQDQFTNEAAGLGNAGSQVLAGEQTGLTGELTKDLTVPGIGLQEASSTEQTRDNAALAKISNERQKVLGNVPNVIAKTRTEMSKQEQEREANRLQEQIASKKLGFEKGEKLEVAKEKNQLVREAAKEKNEATEAIKRQEVGIKEEAVQNQKKALEEKIAVAKNKKQEAEAKLAATRYDNGLKIMTAYLKENPKTEYRAGAPNAQTLATEGKVEYRRNAQDLYNKLTQQGNLTAPEAFRIMGSSGNGYIEQFAREHEAIYNAKLHPVTRRVTNKAGGPQEQRIGAPPNLPPKKK